MEATRLLQCLGPCESAQALLKADPKTPLPADPDDKSDAAKRTRRSIKREVSGTFESMRETIPQEVADAFEHNDNADEAMDAVDLGALDKFASDAISDALHDVFVNAGHRALDSLGVDDDKIIDIFNQRAADYAHNRAAELVGRKWVNGKLVDNPDARWAISETTRDGLRGMITKSYEEGKTPAQLADQIEKSFLFSEDRAEMIARTETAKASVQGSLGAWKDSGVVKGKSWQMSNDHDQDDECDTNEDDGVIGIDDTFSSGDDGPPAHPNCDCVCIPSLEGPEDEEEETEKLAKAEANGWIGVDLDSTLAHFDGDRTTIGEPTAMLARVKRWLSDGEDVRIFTARVSDDPDSVQRRMIEDWCREHIGQVLAITCVKDHQMVEMWDDRAVRVERNTGKRLSPSEKMVKSAQSETPLPGSISNQLSLEFPAVAAVNA